MLNGRSSLDAIPDAVCMHGRVILVFVFIGCFITVGLFLRDTYHLGDKMCEIVIFIESRVQIFAFFLFGLVIVEMCIDSVEQCFDATDLMLCWMIAIVISQIH